MTITLPEETITEKPIEVRVLERAALIIEEHGHCCGALIKDGACPAERAHWVNSPQLTYCELGAIWRAGFEFGLLPRTFEDLAVIAANSGKDDDETYYVIGRAVGLSKATVENIYIHNDEAHDARKSAAHLRWIAQEWQSTKS